MRHIFFENSEICWNKLSTYEAPILIVGFKKESEYTKNCDC